MPITYEGAGTATANASASTTCVVAYPTGILAGDQIVIFVGSASATLPTLPGTFTSRLTGQSGGTSPSFLIGTRTATGAESGTVTVTTGSAQNQGRMFLFRGVDQTTPIDVAGSAFGSSTATTAYNIPSLTTTVVGVALFYYGDANIATGTWTPPTVPAAFTETHDSPASSPNSGAGYLIWAGSGATGVVNLVRSASIRGAAGLIALRPEPTSAPPGAGTATGAYAYAGTSSGKEVPKATGVGAYAWAGSATGTRPATAPPKQGAATGAYAWAGTSSGKRAPKATTTGAYAWAGTGAGLATRRGSGTGAYLWARQNATGSATRRGTGSGAYAWAGTATGARPGVAPPGQGAGTGAYAWARIAATGKRNPKATTTGAYLWAGTASGRETPKGASTIGTYRWTGTAQGVKPLPGVKAGTALGAYAWNRVAATGKARRVGAANGAYAYAGTSSGTSTRRGAANGSYAFVGSATGEAPTQGGVVEDFGGNPLQAWSGGVRYPVETFPP